MPNVRGFSQSFTGGVVTPEFWGRLDDPKYQTGLAMCDNFIVEPHGPLINAPGTQYVNACRTSATQARLFPFTYSTKQTMVLEFGAGYIRFHNGGQSLLTPVGRPAYAGGTTYNQGDLVTSSGITYYSMVGGNIGNTPVSSPTFWWPMGTYYDIPSPYAAADLFAITFVQSADVMTFCHPNYPPMELRRYGATNWQLLAVAFGNTLTVVTSPSCSTTRGSPASSSTKIYKYQITNVSDDGKSESAPVNVSSAAQNLLDSGATNTLSWASSGTRFNVYRLSGGLYSLMGAATTGAFVDDGSIIPDGGFTPPVSQFPFSTDYPGAVSYYQQRRTFAGTTLFPQKLWATRSGTESDLAYSIPIRDDDALSFKIAALQVNTIQHIVSMSSLILLTSSAVWRVTSSSGGAITPSTIFVTPDSGVGANGAQPIINDTTALYVSSRGGHVRELGFNWQTQSFTAMDTSLRAPHLFDGNDITQMAFQRAPTAVYWAVSTTGNLLGMTYVPEQEVRAWFRRTSTNGIFESVCCVAEGVEDRVYVIVKRVINGVTVRYVERMAPRIFSALPNSVFVDCAGTYNGAPTNVVTGLTWLEGQTVNILADGAVMPQQVVRSGAITITEFASVIQVGIPIVAQIQTLPFGNTSFPGAGQGRAKNVNRIFFRVNASGGLKAGPDVNTLVQAKTRTTESPGSPPNLVADEIEIVMMPGWSTGGQIIVQQTDPLPLTILSMTPELAVGS